MMVRIGIDLLNFEGQQLRKWEGLLTTTSSSSCQFCYEHG